MSVTVQPNTGILGNDTLDRLRADALMAAADAPLPEMVVYYLRALESAHLDFLIQRKKEGLREIAWPMMRGDPHA